MPEPGLTVILTGHLSAPEGPVEPGGYDFRRQAWFDGLGAVGYTRTPVLALQPGRGGRGGPPDLPHPHGGDGRDPEGRVPGPVGRLRGGDHDRRPVHHRRRDDRGAAHLEPSAHPVDLRAAHGAGDRLRLRGRARSAWRRSRRSPCGCRPRRSAAGAALVAGALYLALSGSDVPAERAFMQVAVVLVAVLLDRRALTLRAVALAAVIVLTAPARGADRARLPDVLRRHRRAGRGLRGLPRDRTCRRAPPRAARGGARSCRPSSPAPRRRPSRRRISTRSRTTGFWRTRSPCR